MTIPAEDAIPRRTNGRLSHLWSEIRTAARGTKHDYTSGSIGRAIFLLAVPMVMEMMMESVFVVVDIFWVAHLGAEAVAIVGLTESMMVIVYTIAFGLTIGASATVARRIGEKDLDGAANAAVQAIALGFLVSGTLAVCGAIFAPDLLRMMGASPDVLEQGTRFARVMLGGSVTAFMLFTVNSVFRGAGDASVAMRVLWRANAFNMILAPMLIVGLGPFPELGVTGAAVATTIGRGTGMLLALRQLGVGSGHLVVRREHVRVDPRAMARLARLCASGTFQVFVSSAAWIGLIRILSSFGSVAVAGYTIAIRIVIFAILPAFGLSNAAATMVGQSLGAKDPARAEKSVWTAAKFNLAFLGALGVVFIAFAPLIVSAFTPEQPVRDVAVSGLRIVALGFPMFAFGMVLTQAFNGAGDTWTPTWVYLGVFWLFEIPLAWWLAHEGGLAYSGVFWSITLGYAALVAAAGYLFNRGKWKTRTV
ncbi:MAG TPA: MATE family efflux transporter [Gemmatimonadaceae bacterium]|nr:MATE family efflux transporter [Gemmatimonadaceae bacterium]